MAARTSADAPEGRRRATALATRFVFTATAVGWVLWRVDPGQAVEALRGAPAWAFLAPAALLLGNVALHALRIGLLLRAAGAPVPYLQVLGALLRAAFVGLVLPTGGADVAKIAFLARANGRTDAAIAALFTTRVLELIPWGGLLLWGLAWGLLTRYPPVGAAAVVFSVVFAGMVLLAAAGARFGPRIAGRLPGRLGRHALRAAEATARIRHRPDLVAACALLAVPFAIVNCSVVWVVLLAYGISVPYTDVLAVIPAADTLISLPVTISGVGVREGVFVYVLAPWGVTEALAVAVGLTRWTGELSRAALGAVLFLVGDRIPSSVPHEAVEDDD